MSEALERIQETRPRRFRPYRETKDSDVVWLGEIPAHWEVTKVTWLFSIGSGTTPRSGDPDYYGGDMPWVTTSELRETVVNATEKRVTHKALREFSSLKIHPPGSVAVAMYGATIGRLGILGVAATVNQACCVFSHPKGIDMWFWFYWLQMRRSHLIALGYGGGQPNLSQELLRSIRVPTPPVREQQAIVSYLETETTKIDALVVRKERLIELLQEKRTALITCAVTRGLDPNVHMKDSGVEWLGEIPAHWEVKRVRHVVSRIEQGWSPSCDNREAGPDEWGVLKAGCVNRGIFVESEHKALPLTLDPIRQLEIAAGNLLMSRASGSRELVGSVAIVPRCRRRLLLCDKLFRLHVKSASMDRVFARYALNSRFARCQIEVVLSGGGGLANNIAQEAVRDLVLARPPGEEQHDIVHLLDCETTKIDALTDKVAEAIDRLKEYRMALISAAVTGKIDVRGEVAGAA